jgi:sulfane dehydrogenase subunit SoxC
MARQRAKDALEPAAGNGLLHRRALLQQGLVLATAAAASPALAQSPEAPASGGVEQAAASPLLRQPGAPFSPYGQPSPHERRVMRAVAGNTDVPGNGVSWTPLEALEGIITPSGLHFERHHNGVPAIDPKQHQLAIRGLVQRPLAFSIDSLLRYPMRSQLIFLECGGNSNAGWHAEPIQRPVGAFHGMISCSEWTGVPLSLLLDEAGVRPEAAWAVAEGADAGALNVSLPLAKLREDCIVALYQNGERLRPEQGYPVRLIVPGWEGILNVKWLNSLELAAAPAMTRDETAKYTELQPSGKARMFTYVMEAKSLITSPSAMQKLRSPGFTEIKGLAWSGRGRIARVDVSADGGKSWAQAQLQEPVLPRCLTRFRAAWNWSGGTSVLKSRATDETGYVQPERDVLIAQRGRRGYFHYNAIVAWEVAEDGTVSHVYA